jgi:hypothetical protein
MTNRKAPESVMRDLCEAVSKYWSSSGHGGEVWTHLCAYRAATAPLRTRQEVDGELVSWVRESVATNRHINSTWNGVLRLCSEPTANEPSALVDRVLASDEPEACSCEESEDLKRKLQHVRDICGRYGASCCAGDVLTVLDGA